MLRSRSKQYKFPSGWQPERREFPFLANLAFPIIRTRCMGLLVAITAAAVVQAWLLTWAARHLARWLNVLDRPDGGRKTHARPTPLLGGVAVFAAVLLATAQYHWLASTFAWGASLGHTSQASNRVTWMLIFSGGLFCALGVWDDKWGLRPRTKLFWQVVAAIPFVLWGDSIERLNVLGHTVYLGVWGPVLTVFWLTVCTNAVNLIDGLDGVAGSVAVVVSVTVAALALIAGQPGIAVLALILAGASTGFLLHNWPPAKIFLGDAGSLTIGFFLGALAIEGSLKRATGLSLILPLVLMSVPTFDTSMAILRRVLRGRGIGQGDRNHLHHCLRDRGLSGRQALLTIAGLCAAMGAAAIASVLLEMELLALAICGGLLAWLVASRVFGHTEATLVVRHLQVLRSWPTTAAVQVQTRETLDRLRQRFVAHPADSWRLLCDETSRLGVESLEFRFLDQRVGREVSGLSWESAQFSESPDVSWQLVCTARTQRDWTATLRASGSNSPEQRTIRLDDLQALLEAFCHSYGRHLATMRPRHIIEADSEKAVSIPLPHRANQNDDVEPGVQVSQEPIRRDAA